MLDVIKLTREGGATGALYVQIIGIKREDSVANGSIDTLTGRLVYTPSTWVLGDSALSILGTSTILGS